MASRTAATDVSRRDALKAVGAVVAGATLGLSGSRRAESQTPKRGGVFRICAFTDPSGFDPHLTTFDVTRRRAILYDIQRYLAEQAYISTARRGKSSAPGAVRQELHAESRQRLWRPAHGRLAGQMSLETAFL
jgi:hypothetical protein